MRNHEREPLAGYATQLQWLFAQDGLRLDVDESHPDKAKHHVTLEGGGIPLIAVDEERVKRLCSGLYELEAYTLRFILTHPACTLGEVLMSRRGKDLPATSPKQMQEAAEKLEKEGRIHLTRRWVADAESPVERREREEMDSLGGPEYLQKMAKTDPETVKRWEQEGLVKKVPAPPHEPPASER